MFGQIVSNKSSRSGFDVTGNSPKSAAYRGVVPAFTRQFRFIAACTNLANRHCRDANRLKVGASRSEVTRRMPAIQHCRRSCDCHPHAQHVEIRGTPAIRTTEKHRYLMNPTVIRRPSARKHLPLGSPGQNAGSIAKHDRRPSKNLVAPLNCVPCIKIQRPTKRLPVNEWIKARAF